MSYNPSNPNGQATSANSAPVVIASDQSAISVSIGSIALPTGASTSAKQDVGNTSVGNVDSNLGAKADGVASTDTGTFSLIALIKRLLGKFPGLGSATSANSSPVVIASDQGAIPVTVGSIGLPTGASTENTLALIKAKTDNIDVALSTRTKPTDTQIIATTDSLPATQNITTQDLISSTNTGANSQSIITGVPTASSSATFTTSSYESAAIQVSGTWTGTVQSEVSFDGGTTWYVRGIHQSGTIFTSAAFTGNLGGILNLSGTTGFRLRATAAITGTAVVKVVLSLNPSSVYLANSIKIQDANGGTAQSAVKAASTAAIATDPALVVAISPNNVVPVSVSSLPLPTLAATSTKQSDGSQKTQIVDGSGNVISSTANAIDVNIKSGSTGSTITTNAALESNGNLEGINNTINSPDFVDNNNNNTSSLALGLLATAFDRNDNVALNVSTIDIKKDQNTAIVPSDAPAPIYSQGNALNVICGLIDTTGYQSIAVQLFGTFSATVTFKTSNDGVLANALAVAGYPVLGSSTPVTTAAAAGMFVFPCIGRFLFIQITTYTSGMVQALSFLRQAPLSISMLSTPFIQATNLSTNMAQYGGSAVVTGGVAGVPSVGGNVAAGVAPTANPVPIGGTDGTLTRRILTDTSGRIQTADLFVDAQGTQRQSGTIPNTDAMVTALAVRDVTQMDGDTMIVLLSKILSEMKMQNMFMSELPRSLQSALNNPQPVSTDDPEMIRNDQGFTMNLN